MKKKKSLSTQNLYLVKASSKNEGKIKTFLAKRTLSLLPAGPTLQQMPKEVL